MCGRYLAGTDCKPAENKSRTQNDCDELAKWSKINKVKCIKMASKRAAREGKEAEEYKAEELPRQQYCQKACECYSGLQTALASAV